MPTGYGPGSIALRPHGRDATVRLGGESGRSVRRSYTVGVPYKWYTGTVKAVAYVRVSSDKQADFGVSLEVQTTKAKAMATLQGAELVDIIVDGGASGKTLDRPGMKTLIQLVEAKKINAVIVTKLDRLTRSVKDLAELLELFTRRSVSLISVAESLDTATPAGRFVINLLIAIAQWEREEIASRTRSAMRFKKSKGERVGNIAYGYQLAPDMKHLVPNEAEQFTLRTIKKARSVGRTLREIASDLNHRGFTTRRGGLWHHVYVSNVLKGDSTALAA